MLEDIKHTIKQSAIYGLSRISSKLVSFILLPIYSLNFSVSEYGIIVRVETLWQIFWAIFLFGLESGVIRWYTQIIEPEKKKKFLFTVSIFILILNLIFFLAIIPLSSFFSKILLDSSNYSNLVLFASLIASMETFSFFVFLLLRIDEKSTTYTIFAILSSFLNLAFQCYYIYYTSIKLEGIFISKIISPLVIIILLLPYYFKHIKFGFEKSILNDLILYSFPIMLATFVSTLLNQSNRYILGYLTNSNEVGIYGLGYNICGLIGLIIISPYSLAFSVISWKKLNDINAKRFFTKSVTYLFLIIIYFGLFISLFTPHFIKIFALNSDYWLAKDIVPWIIFSFPFYGIQTISIFSFYVTKKTKNILYFYIASLILNIVLNFTLIPFFKMYGSAIANFISFVFLSFLFYFYSKSEYFFNYEWKKILQMLVCSIILTFPFFYFQIDSRLEQIFLKIFALILFPFILYIFGFFEKIELERSKDIIRKYLLRKK